MESVLATVKSSIGKSICNVALSDASTSIPPSANKIGDWSTAIMRAPTNVLVTTGTPKMVPAEIVRV